MNIFKKVSIKDKLPEEGKNVVTIDSKGNGITYKRFGENWNMPLLEDNHPIEYWLEETKLPTDEDIQSESWICGASQVEEREGFIRGAKWVINCIKNGFFKLLESPMDEPTREFIERELKELKDHGIE
jgi:hypothetical protein